MPSQQQEPPPLPLNDEAFEEVPVLLKEIEKAIASASGNELKVLRLMLDHLKNIDHKTVRGYNDSRKEFVTLASALGHRFDRLPNEEAIEQVVASELVDVHRRFDTLVGLLKQMQQQIDAVDHTVTDTSADASQTLALAKETVRYTQKIPRVLKTAQATLIVADRAAKAGAKQSRLIETHLDMLAELRARERAHVSLVPEYDIGQADMVEDEPAAGNNVFPIRPTRRSTLGMVATVALTFATAAFSMSGAPYTDDDKPAMECAEDPSRKDIYDCGTGHLWIATQKTPNANGGVDLDLKPYTD